MILKIRNRIFKKSTLLAICLVISCDAFAITSITTCKELQNMNLNLSDTYALANDIDCSGFNFTPVGSYNTPFTGKLYGMGHKISNLSISISGTVGLFGQTIGAVIQQLILDNITINYNSNGNYGGALVGYAKSTKISDISASGTVNISGSGGGLVGQLTENSSLTRISSSINVLSRGQNIGGLVGRMLDSSVSSQVSFIRDSFVTGTVNGPYMANDGIGGLVGFLQSGSISDSYATGDIGLSVNGTTGNARMGGLVGGIAADLHPVSVTRCYSTGNITGDNQVNTTAGEAIGGLIGLIGGTKHISVTDSFATGSVFGALNVGGLIGVNNSSFFSLSNSYSVGKVVTTTNKTTGGLIGYDYSNGLSTLSSYWDMQKSGQTISAAGTGKTTIEMYQQNTYDGWDFNNTWSIKEGMSYPILMPLGIKNCADLQSIKDHLDRSYVLLNDINCSGVTFTPIGVNNNPFTGSLNGNGHIISNLSISLPNEGEVGLFGNTQNAIIKNIIFKNAYMVANSIAGVLVGDANTTVISNISAYGQVYGVAPKGYYCGGLIGELNNAGIVSHSMANVIVNANNIDRVGGLVGGLIYSQIVNGYSTGSVTSQTGIVGGFVGYSISGNISNSYSIGKVTGKKDLAEGFLGSNYGVVTNSYFNTETSGQQYSNGGTGKTTSQLYQQSTYVNWDFNNVWDIENGVNYPWLRTTEVQATKH